MSIVPRFLCLAWLEGKRATNSCDCKRSSLELTRYCSGIRRTACSVSWRQIWEDAIQKISRMYFPTAQCTFERRPKAKAAALAEKRKVKTPTRKTRVWGTQNLPYGSSLGHAAQFLSNTILGLFPPLVLAVLQKFTSVVILAAAIA